MADFEGQLTQLLDKIKDLRAFAQEQGIDLGKEIAALEEKAAELRAKMYANLSPWQKIQLARNIKRPTTLDYINLIFTEFVELHGDRQFRDDPALVGGIALLEGRPVTVLGHQKGRDTKDNIARNFGMPHPEGYRKALRLMAQAEKYRRPIICFIDTPGAYPGLGAEERGQSEAIARNLREMATFRVPILNLVTGEGGSGGALALGVGDSLLMLENTVYSVISPEGCASILWKDASRAKEAAAALKLTAQDLDALGVIDEVIPEPQGGIHRDWEGGAIAVKEALLRHLDILGSLPLEALLRRRHQRLAKLGRWQEH
ncbi:MAG: acetyl-CoA carboxylase carboxyltransferase subunit alpha [Bacillota bacterium]